MCEIYPHATRFQVFKYRVRRGVFKLFRALLVVSFVAGAFYSTFKVGVMAASSNVQNFSLEQEVDHLPAKIQELKDELLGTLRSCEDRGLKSGRHGIITDTNGKISVGPYKFQVSTVQHFVRMKELKEITEIEAVELAMDLEKSTGLASYAIFETPNGVSKDWVNCDRKYDLTAKLNLIKKLEN